MTQRSWSRKLYTYSNSIESSKINCQPNYGWATGSLGLNFRLVFCSLKTNPPQLLIQSSLNRSTLSLDRSLQAASRWTRTAANPAAVQSRDSPDSQQIALVSRTPSRQKSDWVRCGLNMRPSIKGGIKNRMTVGLRKRARGTIVGSLLLCHFSRSFPRSFSYLWLSGLDLSPIILTTKTPILREQFLLRVTEKPL